MKLSWISRVVVALAAAGFAALAVSFWAVPAGAVRFLGLEVVRAAGAAAVRSDLGGLFAGLALLCAGAAWKASRPCSLAAACMLATVIAGRLLGAVAGSIDLGALGLEALVCAALVVLARGPSTVSLVPRRRLLAGAALLGVSSAGLAATVSPAVQLRIFETAARQRAALVNDAPLLDDALRVAVCGSSAPLPSAARAKSCIAVFAGGKFYIVDAGPESVERLVLWGIPLSSIGGVLLTHFHSDHIGDLGELNLQSWAGGRPRPLPVYGGPGVEGVVAGFNAAYQLDQRYRTAHHGERVMPRAAWTMVPHVVDFAAPPTPAKDRTAVVVDEGGLRITAIEVDHTPIAPAYAYRFDYKGRSALITGDLKLHAPLTRAARGVDLLVSEAIAPHMTRALGQGASTAGRQGTAAIMHDIEDYHMTPAQAAQVANDAGATLLAFYHLLPAPDGPLARSVFAAGVDDTRRGNWTIADDGSLYTLPLGAGDIRIGRVDEP